MWQWLQEYACSSSVASTGRKRPLLLESATIQTDLIQDFSRNFLDGFGGGR